MAATIPEEARRLTLSELAVPLLIAHALATLSNFFLDVWKTRRQTLKLSRTLPGCFIEAFGWAVFFKGLVPELLAVSLSLVVRLWVSLTIGYSIFALPLAVFAVALLTTPFEHWKVHHQTITSTAHGFRFREWIPFGMWRGVWAILIRDEFFFLTFFLLYPQVETMSFQSVASAAVIHAFASVLSHPFDVVKTHQQTLGSGFDKKSTTSVLRLLYLDEGLMGLSSGLLQRTGWVLAKFIVVFLWYNVLILIYWPHLAPQVAITLQLL